MATATLKVKNLRDHDVSEVFPYHGEVFIGAGETKRIPADVAQVWAQDGDRNGGKAIVELLEGPTTDEEPAETEPKTKRTKAKVADPATVEAADKA